MNQITELQTRLEKLSARVDSTFGIGTAAKITHRQATTKAIMLLAEKLLEASATNAILAHVGVPIPSPAAPKTAPAKQPLKAVAAGLMGNGPTRTERRTAARAAEQINAPEIWKQYAAIKDSSDKTAFYRSNKKALDSAFRQMNPNN